MDKKINLEKLEKKFTGTGEVGGKLFVQIKEGDNAYIYEVDSTYYEVFLKRETAKMIDFATKEMSETEFKEVYPKAARFGYSAWSYQTLASAEKKFQALEELSKESVVTMTQKSVR